MAGISTQLKTSPTRSSTSSAAADPSSTIPEAPEDRKCQQMRNHQGKLWTNRALPTGIPPIGELIRPSVPYSATATPVAGSTSCGYRTRVTQRGSEVHCSVHCSQGLDERAPLLEPLHPVVPDDHDGVAPTRLVSTGPENPAPRRSTPLPSKSKVLSQTRLRVGTVVTDFVSTKRGIGQPWPALGAMTTFLSVLRASLNYEEQGENRQERPLATENLEGWDKLWLLYINCFMHNQHDLISTPTRVGYPCTLPLVAVQSHEWDNPTLSVQADCEDDLQQSSLDADSNICSTDTESPLTSMECLPQGIRSTDSVRTWHPTLIAVINKTKKLGSDDTRSKEITKKIAEMVCTDDQPFSIVEDVGFCRLISHLEHRYLMLSHSNDCSIPTKMNRVQSPAGSLLDFGKWKLCRMMPLVGGCSLGSPVSPAFQCCSILTSFHSHRLSRPHQLAPFVLPEGVLGWLWVRPVRSRGSLAEAIGAPPRESALQPPHRLRCRLRNRVVLTIVLVRVDSRTCVDRECKSPDRISQDKVVAPNALHQEKWEGH
ncbi:hypothetical protein PR048_033214 [Dryococelus australis]|uniref:Uncharacterized protein n=1 Tax=Dryococelus australis TaxID=614101 RepID=A0ABQ9G3X0_9NEOP|nr:hypothetical protein PR048_033214 [Dryococelus australis]